MNSTTHRTFNHGIVQISYTNKHRHWERILVENVSVFFIFQNFVLYINKLKYIHNYIPYRPHWTYVLCINTLNIMMQMTMQLATERASSIYILALLLEHCCTTTAANVVIPFTSTSLFTTWWKPDGSFFVLLICFQNVNNSLFSCVFESHQKGTKSPFEVWPR